MKGEIKIEGARENNLKNLNFSIPWHKFTVITGLSGSGKSSLALDTLYAEGLRRYIECLSTYARQFLERVERSVNILTLRSIHCKGSFRYYKYYDGI